MIQVENSFVCKGMQNLEWAILPPSRNKEAIPLEATFRTISPSEQRVADNV